MSSTKLELHSLVERRTEGNAEVALEYLHELVAEGDVLADDDVEEMHRGEQETERGEFVTLAELRRRTTG